VVLSAQQVVTTFGDPARFIDPAGHVSGTWELAILRPFPLPAPLPFAGSTALVRIVRCHRLILPFMRQAFEEIYVEGAWSELGDFGGCYCWRTQRQAPTARSRHSWGIAVDVNVAHNGFLQPPNMAPAIVSAFKRAGFAWGGEFVHRPDPMHFEFADLGRLVQR